MKKMLEEVVDLKFQNYRKMYPEADSIEKKPITNWLPLPYKERFDKLQRQTKCRFGKDIQEMIMKAIDLADKAS